MPANSASHLPTELVEPPEGQQTSLTTAMRYIYIYIYIYICIYARQFFQSPSDGAC